MNYCSIRNIILVASMSMMSGLCFAQKKSSGWTSLFNGKDLSGWDTYLRAANMTGYDNAQPVYEPPIGLNNDPLKVFTVEHGVIHISGQVWGAITSKAEYSNYHIRFQTKWGEQKWAPRDTGLRDAGFLFHCTDGFDFAYKCWMRSVEMQVQEGEIGDYFLVGAGEPEFQTSPGKTSGGVTVEQYDPSAPLKRFKRKRVYRSGDFESPPGEWTTSEVVARQADAVYIVNGFVVNRLFNIFRADLNQQVTRGKLQFQSESAEHYVRNIEIRSLSFVQTKPALVSKEKSIVIAPGERRQMEIVNEGEEVEIIAAEIIGKEIDRFMIKLPPMPMILKKGQKIMLPVSLKDGSAPGNTVTFKLETALGPVAGFEVTMTTK